MKRFRIGIAGLMAMILLLAATLGALRQGLALLASVTFATTALLLGAAILGAVAREGVSRMRWLGFAVFGWIYLGMAFGPWPNGNGVTIPPLPTMLLFEPLRRSANSLVDAATKPGVAPSKTDPGVTYPMANFSCFRNSKDSGPRPESLFEVGTTYRMPAIPTSAGPPEAVGAAAPAMVAFTPPVVDSLQLRRILHSLGAIACGLIGAGIGWAFAAAPRAGAGS
jgi:hypothetical protein